MNQDDSQLASPAGMDDATSRSRRLGAAAWCALAAAFLAVSGLAPKTIFSPDLGYHLAYGDHFLQTGDLVDSSEFVYVQWSEQAYPPGPACWYDEQGRYRFPNANWLSQIVMALSHQWGGELGLGILQMGLILGVFALSLTTLRLGRVGPTAAGAGLLVLALAMTERLTLRPELFSYLILAGQLCLLRPAATQGKGLGRLAIVILIQLQWLLANLHSYWLLGLACTGALLTGELLHWIGNRFKARANPECLVTARVVGVRARKLAVVLAGQLLVVFVNPWTWRLASLPLETMLFLRSHDIAAGSSHPWATISEFFPPMHKDFGAILPLVGLFLTMGLAGLGAAACLARRRWGDLLLILGMVLVSFSMRRNIAVGGLVILPVSLIALHDLGRSLPKSIRHRAGRPWLGAVASLVVLVASGIFGWGVVTGRYYYLDRFVPRFGLGYDKSFLPWNAAAWIRHHQPAGRVWTSYNPSSTICYFGERNVPLLTNTWAYPPNWMATVLQSVQDASLFEDLAEQYDLQTVCVDRTTGGALLSYLAQHRQWSIVSVEPRFAVFVNNTGPNAELAARETLRPGLLDLDREFQTIIDETPLPAGILTSLSMTYQQLLWDDAAIEAARRATEMDPDWFPAWYQLGHSHALRSQMRRKRFAPGAREDLLRAEECLWTALRLEPNNQNVRNYLREVQADLNLVR